MHRCERDIATHDGPRIDQEDLWVRQARAGDRQAFEELARRYLERTFHVVLRMVGNREDAEDVVQETFARAQAHLSRFRGTASFGTWVTSISIRLCLDLERARRRRPAPLPLPGAASSSHPRDSSPPPAREMLQREASLVVQRGVAELPHRLRSALVLRVLEDMDYPTVAQILGTTVRSARIYVSEARRRLGEWVERHYGALDP